MANSMKYSKFRIFNPFDEKIGFLVVISCFNYRDRPGPGQEYNHRVANAHLLNLVKNQTPQISATAVLNLTKFNLLKNFEKG